MSKVKPQEALFTSGADTRGTRLAHEKMPEPEEEPAEAAVAQDPSLPEQQVSGDAKSSLSGSADESLG